jgi:hypothetical protein
MILPEGGRPYELLGKGSATAAQFSPGPGQPQWIAFSIDDVGGRREVYVRPFIPGNTGNADRIQISTEGGSFPRWRADGKVMFYQALDGKMMEVAVNGSGAVFEHGTPVPLFAATVPQTRNPDYLYDVTPDGQRFIIVEPAQQAETIPLTLMTNWRAALKR